MTEEITLAQLAQEIAQLRAEVKTVNQRLDMIYGAVTRLADQSGPAPATTTQPSSGRPSGFDLSPTAMMDPGSMLDALHNFAVKSGLEISEETVERLKKGSESGGAEE